MRTLSARTLLLAALACAPLTLGAQGTAADYTRAAALVGRSTGLSVDVMDAPAWIGSSSRIIYRKSVDGGHQFLIADAASQTKQPAFDHARLATAINALTNGQSTATTLPFTVVTLDDDQHISFALSGGRGRGAPVAGAGAPPTYRCSIIDYVCTKVTVAPIEGGGRGGRGGRPPAALDESPAALLDENGDVIPNEGVWDDGWHDGADVLATLALQQQGRGAAQSDGVRVSPDGKVEALILNYNVYVRPAGATTLNDASQLSYDGSEGNFFTLQSIVWSPDSKKLVAYRVVPGYRRQVHYVLSSPPDQLQPKDTTLFYNKPGDRLDVRQPVLMDIATRKATIIDNTLFPNAYSIQAAQWWKDGRGFTFEYNQRGHQVYRVIEVDANTARPRAVIDEQSKTFINYRRTNGGLADAGRTYRYDVADGKEMIWMSERDGWAHLYLYNAAGQVKNQITKGQFVVRAVDRVDEAKRQIWFEASGMNPKQDPYFTHYYRINFDGTGLVALTDGDGSHTVSFSQSGEYYTDVWSRVDMPPIGQIRRTSDQKVVLDLEKGTQTERGKSNGPLREVFHAKARDGVTDIWGTIQRPATFDPAKKYPVIEAIYAGPQGSFVAKTWADLSPDIGQAEPGYIVVHIDGMGTNNRSKAFHDVAYKNLGDAGFPDRILWHQAVAAKYPWYDVSRVGIYGTSAGGQNAMGAVVFHPEFYKAAYANSGCHDNRMDKIWWNEQWMGWPLDETYDKSSNLINAYRMKGHLILVAGEFDTNVDPASQSQVVNALIRANKTFEFVLIPNGGHGAGGTFAINKRNDMFNKVFYNVDAPDRNSTDEKPLAPFGR